MITDIPTPQDFETVGVALLNQAWDTAISLLLHLRGVEELEAPEAQEYWEASKTKLATSLTIAQQGGEFLLKARIAAVSPFLLIANTARDWPKADKAGNVSFSLFRTVDAQDLVRLHDNCAPVKLSPNFITQFNALRVRRNTIMHTVDKKFTLQVEELIEGILLLHQHLASTSNWVNVRREFLNDSEASTLYSTDWVEPQLVEEFIAVRELLDPKAMKQYFGHDKKQRLYICPNCSYRSCRDYEFEARLALLRPNDPTSIVVWCFVCGELSNVVRSPCKGSDCRGNVISQRWGKCLTCGADQTELPLPSERKALKRSRKRPYRYCRPHDNDEIISRSTVKGA